MCSRQRPLPITKLNQGIVFFKRSLAELEVFHGAHAGVQLLRLFAERIELINLVQIPY